MSGGKTPPMASESASDLLPCPFCGREPAFVPYKRDGLTLKCPSFGCVKFSQRAMRFDLEWLRGKMTESWNRRAPSAEAKDAGRLDWVVENSMFRVQGPPGSVRVLDMRNGLTFFTQGHATIRDAIDAAMAKQSAIAQQGAAAAQEVSRD